METTKTFAIAPDEAPKITRKASISDRSSLLYTNIPGVVVLCSRLGLHHELREIMYISGEGVESVVGRGPIVRYSRRSKIEISWFSGNAKSVEAMAREVQVMRLAQAMAEELSCLHG